MRAVILVLLCMLSSSSLMAQFRLKKRWWGRGRVSTSSNSMGWTIDRDSITSKDTITFTFTVNSKTKNQYYYVNPDHYVLYQETWQGWIPLEDTSNIYRQQPVKLKKGDQVMVKKVIKSEGSYALRYTVYTAEPFSGDNKIIMEQPVLVGPDRRKL